MIKNLQEIKLSTILRRSTNGQNARILLGLIISLHLVTTPMLKTSAYLGKEEGNEKWSFALPPKLVTFKIKSGLLLIKVPARLPRNFCCNGSFKVGKFVANSVLLQKFSGIILHEVYC